MFKTTVNSVVKDLSNITRRLEGLAKDKFSDASFYREYARTAELEAVHASRIANKLKELLS